MPGTGAVIILRPFFRVPEEKTTSGRISTAQEGTCFGPLSWVVWETVGVVQLLHSLAGPRAQGWIASNPRCARDQTQEAAGKTVDADTHRWKSSDVVTREERRSGEGCKLHPGETGFPPAAGGRCRKRGKNFAVWEIFRSGSMRQARLGVLWLARHHSPSRSARDGFAAHAALHSLIWGWAPREHGPGERGQMMGLEAGDSSLQKNFRCFI